jgi:p-cumate 2,3-dioxygenase beta subunit
MTPTLEQACALLFLEADLLDRWKLLEWAAMFTDDGQYQVPSPDDPDGVHGHSLYLIDDDRHRLEQRARRLLDPAAHAEVPRSRTCRMVGNVRLLDGASVHSHFVLYRSKGERLDIFPGHACHELQQDAAGGWRIRRKRAVLSLADLRLQGKLSLIV